MQAGNQPNLLGQNTPQTPVQGIKGREKSGIWNMGSKNRPPPYLHEHPLGLQGAGHPCQVLHELTVIPASPKKLVTFFLFLGSEQDVIPAVLSVLGCTCPPLKMLPQILYHLPSNCTLLQASCELRLPQRVQDYAHPLHMLHTGVAMDSNITAEYATQAIGMGSKQFEWKCNELVEAL